MREKGVRESYRPLVKTIDALQPGELGIKDELVKKLFMTQGITFTVYGDNEGVVDIWTDKEIMALIKKLNIELISYKDLLK